jgi:hypothetical protein
MEQFEDDSSDELLRTPLSRETFEQLLRIFAQMQRATPEQAGGTPPHKEAQQGGSAADWRTSVVTGRAEQNMRRVFIGKMNAKTKKHGPREVPEPVGEVSGIRGFAFVEVANEGEAAKVLALLNRQKLDGSLLRLKIVF